MPPTGSTFTDWQQVEKESRLLIDEDFSWSEPPRRSRRHAEEPVRIRRRIIEREPELEPARRAWEQPARSHSHFDEMMAAWNAAYGDAPAGSAYANVPSGRGYRDALAVSAYGDTPAGAAYRNAPAGSAYGDTPAGSAYSDTPAGAAYRNAPAGSAYRDAPAGSAYSDAPVGSAYDHPAAQRAFDGAAVATLDERERSTFQRREDATFEEDDYVATFDEGDIASYTRAPVREERPGVFDLSDPGSPVGASGRRTVVITGHGDDRYVPATRRKSPSSELRFHERSSFSPDRMGLWTVLLGVALLIGCIVH